MKKTTFLIILLILTFNLKAQLIGDAGYIFDESKYDSKYPISKEFVKAGVENGIPDVSDWTQISVSKIENLQDKIDELSKKGGGVILLEPGIYQLNSNLVMKDRIVLQGSKLDQTILQTSLRSKPEKLDYAIKFSNTHNSGIQDVEFKLAVPNNIEPIDREGLYEGNWCNECFKNAPYGIWNLFVGYIFIDSKSSNNWVQNCRLIASGTNPIYCNGSHNTFRSNLIDRCFNKGDWGNGYYSVQGKYNLFINETIKRIRHFVLQQGAQYNVVKDCRIEVDVNFHNGDLGYNLIENNHIQIPTWHGWDIICSGVEGTHKPPGPNNLIYKNVGIYKWDEHRYDNPNKVYSFEGFKAITTNYDIPKFNTFYPVKYDEPTNINEEKKIEQIKIYPTVTKANIFIDEKDIKIEKIEFYTLSGVKVYQVNQDFKKVDISHLDNQIYIVKVITSTNQIVKKIIKQ